MDVNFSDKLNPREFAMNQYDPTDHGSDPLAYLDGYTDRTGRDVTEWSWAMPTESDESQSATELADGRTVTTDVSDVDTVPDDGTDSVQSTSESAKPNDSVPADGQQSGGIATRLKDSVSGVVGRNDSNDVSETVEEPALADIGTVTARMAANLQVAGYESVEEVFEADNSALAEIEGIDITKAAFIRRKAANALGRSPSIVESPETTHRREVATDAENGEEDATSSAQQPEEAQPSDGPENDESADAAEQSPESINASHPALTDIQEVGSDRADVLREAGFETAEDVATASESSLIDIEGIGAARAETIIGSATALLDERSDGAVAKAGGDN